MLRHVHTESELVNRASYRTTFRCLLLSKLATISHSILEFHCIERRERKKKRRRWKGIRIFLSIVYHQDSSIASRNNTERWFTALTISFLAVASNLQRIIRKKKKTIVLVCDDTDLINFQLRELRGYFNLRYFLSVTTRSKYQISCTRAQDF